MQEAHVALQEHLRNASRAAEVAVNLEGSVCVPQVVERAVLKQVAIELVGVVAIVQTGPLVQLPAHRPACCAVSSVLKHHTRCLGKVGRGYGRYGVARMQTEQVVHMSVFILWIINVA